MTSQCPVAQLMLPPDETHHLITLQTLETRDYVSDETEEIISHCMMLMVEYQVPGEDIIHKICSSINIVHQSMMNCFIDTLQTSLRLNCKDL